MKIGILTQPLHFNYGGIIQNWALQQVLKRVGHEPEMISIESGRQPSGKMVTLRTLSLAKCLIKKYLLRSNGVYIHSPLDPRYNPKVSCYCADETFVKRINKTRPLGCDADLSRFVDRRKYDAFIVGSDQVWREEYSPNILPYFFDFVPEGDKRKRIAYAASFGKDHDYISNEKMPECRRLLERFDAVSVRETEGIEIVRRDFGRNQVEKVLDPTLLLSADDYEGIILPEDRHKSPYVASYMLDKSEEKVSILEGVSSAINLSAHKINIDVNSGSMATVSQWLANFADADFVVTDSFHGCVFSIIFGKPFIAVANAERGLGRFVSLLGDFGLCDRLIYNYNDFMTNKDCLLSTPDYALVHNRWNTLRKTSLKFLTDALA